MEGKPVVSDWRARTRVEEYLRKECPIALALLEPAAGYVDTDCLFYRLTPKHRQRFEDLSASPLIDHLARAATQIKQAISVAIKDSGSRPYRFRFSDSAMARAQDSSVINPLIHFPRKAALTASHLY